MKCVNFFFLHITKVKCEFNEMYNFSQVQARSWNENKTGGENCEIWLLINSRYYENNWP